MLSQEFCKSGPRNDRNASKIVKNESYLFYWLITRVASHPIHHRLNPSELRSGLKKRILEASLSLLKVVVHNGIAWRLLTMISVRIHQIFASAHKPTAKWIPKCTQLNCYWFFQTCTKVEFARNSKSNP